MAVTGLPLGVPTVLVANAPTALPVRAVSLISSAASEVSIDGTTWTAHTSGQQPLGVFVRAATAATVVAKPIG